ncbi:MAG: hypothetical protein GX100_02365, partial [candidate division WS1 bacterium]|nr:hypothetical protein [candidate division WS1 bacterium]
EFEAVTVADSRRLSDSFPLTTAVVGESPEEKERELDRKLEGDYDVIVLAPFQFDKLPAKAQLKILRKLKQGTGLLGFMAGARGTQKAFVPLDPPVAGREILRGCAMAGLPYFGIGPEKPRDEVADQQVFTAHFGAGRIAWLNYAAPHSIDSWYAGDTMGRPARPAPLGMVAPTWQTYDVAIATAVRALLWAAQREQPVRVESDLSDGAEVDRSQWPAQFSAKLTRWSPKAPQEVRVEARLVRPDGEFESTTETTVALTGAETPFQVKLGAPPRGVAFLWLIARDGAGAVLDWSVTSLEVTAPHGIEQLQLQTEVLAPGEEADMRVTLQGQPPEGSLLRLEAVDCYERLFWHRQVPAAAQVTFRVPTVAMCGRAGRLQATLVSGEQVLDRREVELFLRRPVGREFINLLWGYPPLGKASWQEVGYLNRLHAERSRSSGFNMGMIFTYPADDPADHAKGFSRTDASSFYYITHIQTTQVRQYLISEEAREKEAARLEELAGKMRPYGCHAYSLGDENGLYGMSLELKPEEVPHFQEFMRRFYEDDLAALNANWDTNYKGFAEVEGPLAEAGKMTVARRYDAMAFWDWAYADVYRWMAQAIRRGDPEASIGAEGSEGRDLEQVLAELDWWAPYHNRDVNTMLRYWLPWSALRGNWWGSYVANRLGPENLWGQLATGSVNSSMFFISSLGAEGLLATDLENADYAQPWIPEMKEICATAGPVVRGAEPVDDGVGIFHSRLAEVANTLDTRFGSMKTEQTRLLDVFDALGVSAKF